MTDHPVLIPTREGAVGGVVSEPRGEARAGLILLGGYGRPARSGVNSFWTRIARNLAAGGIVVLRYDYSREGETLPIGEGGSGQRWKRDLDLRMLTCVAPWFRQRIGELPLLLAGSCSGARLAIELAGRDPDAVAGTFLIVPYLRALPEPGREGAGEVAALDPVDPLVVDCLRRILDRRPSWILTGEHDTIDLDSLRGRLDATPHSIEVEVVPGVALHLLDRPDLHREVEARLASRVSTALAAPTRA